MQNNSSRNAINLIIAKLKAALDIKTDTELAVKLGVRQNTLSTWKKRETIDYPLVISKCDSENIDLNWLFDSNNEDLIVEKLLPELLSIDKNGKNQTGDDKEKLSGILSGELSGIDENNQNIAGGNNKKCIPNCIPNCIPIGENVPKTRIINVFEGLTDAEVEHEISLEFKNYLLEMYEAGRAAPAIEIRRYQQEIKELTMQVAKLEYQLGEIMIKQAISGYSKRGKDDDTPDTNKDIQK